MPVSSYYDILGLPQTASQAEIKQAYRMYSKKYHPDRNPDPNAAAMFRLINEAYTALTSPQCGCDTDEEPQEYADRQANGDPGDHARAKKKISWWKIPFTFLWFLVRLCFAAMIWLPKFPITLIGMIGYVLAAAAGIGMLLFVVEALDGTDGDWMMVLASGIGAMILYVLTLLSSFLLELMNNLRDWLLNG